MDELNLELQSLIQEACRHQPNSPQRRKVINSLLRAMMKLRGTGGKEDHIYEEALQETMIKVSKIVCEKYDPSRGSFLVWFNTCVRNQYRDEKRAEKRHSSRRQFVPPDEEDFDPLKQVASGIDATLLLEIWESLVQWIEEDPDNVLNTCHIKNNPKANCQSLAEMRLVSGNEWKEIAVEVGLTHGVITSHWSRKCQPRLREWLEKNQKLFGENNYER